MQVCRSVCVRGTKHACTSRNQTFLSTDVSALQVIVHLHISLPGGTPYFLQRRCPRRPMSMNATILLH